MQICLPLLNRPLSPCGTMMFIDSFRTALTRRPMDSGIRRNDSTGKAESTGSVESALCAVNHESFRPSFRRMPESIHVENLLQQGERLVLGRRGGHHDDGGAACGLQSENSANDSRNCQLIGNHVQAPRILSSCTRSAFVWVLSFPRKRESGVVRASTLVAH